MSLTLPSCVSVYLAKSLLTASECFTLSVYLAKSLLTASECFTLSDSSMLNYAKVLPSRDISFNGP